MLTVRHGPFQPALERAFLDDLAEARRDDPFAKIWVVAPSRRLSDRLQRLTALEGGQALIGVRFHTFYSLALEIVRDAGELNRVIVRDV
jgi:hypothetical protein